MNQALSGGHEPLPLRSEWLPLGLFQEEQRLFRRVRLQHAVLVVFVAYGVQFEVSQPFVLLFRSERLQLHQTHDLHQVRVSC